MGAPEPEPEPEPAPAANCASAPSANSQEIAALQEELESLKATNARKSNFRREMRIEGLEKQLESMGGAIVSPTPDHSKIQEQAEAGQMLIEKERQMREQAAQQVEQEPVSVPVTQEDEQCFWQRPGMQLKEIGELLDALNELRLSASRSTRGAARYQTLIGEKSIRLEELGVAEEICDTLDMPAASIRTVGILKEDLKDLREANNVCHQIDV